MSGMQNEIYICWLIKRIECIKDNRKFNNKRITKILKK